MKIKIIKPEFFIRCGYEKDQRFYLDEIHQNIVLKDRIERALMSVLRLVEMNTAAHVALQDFYNGVARYRNLRNRTDGAERKIYTTEPCSHYLGRIYRVKSQRTVITGLYRAGRYWGGEEPEWDPPCLCNTKRHTIYKIEGGREIQAENCEVIK